MKVAAVIPARLGSRRFPRKVLARETGKYLVEHVYERVAACRALDRVIIATDSLEVEEAARSFGAEVRLTSPEHLSGTDRVAEVAKDLRQEIIINVQGDEPLVDEDDLRTLIGLFEPRDGAGAHSTVVMTTLAARRLDREGFRDPNIVRVVVGKNGDALYFSRSPVPYPPLPGHPSAGGGGADEVEWLQHIGIYGYSREFLIKLSSLPPTPLEKRERLEQLRALENGYAIRVGMTHHPHLGIDTEEEYRRFVDLYFETIHPERAGGK